MDETIYKIKYTGEQVDDLLTQVEEGGGTGGFTIIDIDISEDEESGQLVISDESISKIKSAVINNEPEKWKSLFFKSEIQDILILFSLSGFTKSELVDYSIAIFTSNTILGFNLILSIRWSIENSEVTLVKGISQIKKYTIDLDQVIYPEDENEDPYIILPVSSEIEAMDFISSVNVTTAEMYFDSFYIDGNLYANINLPNEGDKIVTRWLKLYPDTINDIETGEPVNWILRFNPDKLQVSEVPVIIVVDNLSDLSNYSIQWSEGAQKELFSVIYYEGKIWKLIDLIGEGEDYPVAYFLNEIVNEDKLERSVLVCPGEFSNELFLFGSDAQEVEIHEEGGGYAPHVGEFNAGLITEEGWYDSIVLGRPEGSESDEKYFLYMSSNGGQVCWSRRNSGKCFHRLGKEHSWVSMSHDDYSLEHSSELAISKYTKSQTIEADSIDIFSPDQTGYSYDSNTRLFELWVGENPIKVTEMHVGKQLTVKPGDVIRVRCFYRDGSSSCVHGTDGAPNYRYNSDAYIYLSDQEVKGHTIEHLKSDFIKVKSLGSLDYEWTPEQERWQDLAFVRDYLFRDGSDLGWNYIKCNVPEEGDYYLHITGDFNHDSSWFVIDDIEVYSREEEEDDSKEIIEVDSSYIVPDEETDEYYSFKIKEDFYPTILSVKDPTNVIIRIDLGDSSIDLNYDSRFSTSPTEMTFCYSSNIPFDIEEAKFYRVIGFVTIDFAELQVSDTGLYLFTDNKQISLWDNEEEGSSDLDIADEEGYVIARFKNGHIKTKNFDSSKLFPAETGTKFNYSGSKIDLVCDGENSLYLETIFSTDYQKYFTDPDSGCNGGLAIINDIGVLVFNKGNVVVIQWSTKEVLATGQLASYDQSNYVNSCCFGTTYYDENEIPLLYISQSYKDPSDYSHENHCCYVENLTWENGVVTSELIQTIIFEDDDTYCSYAETIDWSVDRISGHLYGYGCQESSPTGTMLYTMMFELPDPYSEETISLTYGDAIQTWDNIEVNGILQDTSVSNGVVVLPYSDQSSSTSHPGGLVIYDLKNSRYLLKLDTTSFTNLEYEGCCQYDKKIYLIGNHAGSHYFDANFIEVRL